MRHSARPRTRFATALALFALLLLAPATAEAGPRPCAPDNGLEWCAVVHPTSGPIGTRVTVDGAVNPGLDRNDFRIAVANLRMEPGALFLMRDTGPPFCEVIGGVHAARFTVTDTGLIHGSFVVGGDTSCNHSYATAPPLTPGVYTVNLGCQACELTNFTVTPGAATLPFTGLGSLGFMTVAGALILAVGTALTTAARK